MNPRDIAFGQIKAALAVILQAGQTIAEDCNITDGLPELTMVEWRQLNAHLTDAGNACVRALNILTAPSEKDRAGDVVATKEETGGNDDAQHA